jgi:hypothetical protein
VFGTVGLGARGEQAGGVELEAGDAGFVDSVPAREHGSARPPVLPLCLFHR